MSKINRLERYLNKYNRLDGKTYIVTGANSGLGLSATRHFLSLGATVIMACRSINKAEIARLELLKAFPNSNIEILPYDQADFNSIDHFVSVVKSQYSDFAGIILNAGIYHPKQGLKTAQDFPLTMGTNYLGIYYLLKRMKEVGIWDIRQEKRIIFVGSLSWYRVKVARSEAYLTKDIGTPMAQYCRSKTALGALSYQLSRHNEDDLLSVPSHIKVYTMHPGVTATNIVGASNSSYPKWFARLAQVFLNIFVHSPDVAALGIIKLALEDNLSEDKIVVPRGLFHISGYPTSKRYPYNLRLDNLFLLNQTEQVMSNCVKKES